MKTLSSKKPARKKSGTGNSSPLELNLIFAIDSDNDGVADAIEGAVNPETQSSWDHNKDGIADIEQATVASFISSIGARASLSLYNNKLIKSASTISGSLFSQITLRFQGLISKVDNGIINSIKTLQGSNQQPNHDGENKDNGHTILKTTDLARFELTPEVIIEGEVSKAKIAAYQDQVKQDFANKIHRVDYRFDDTITNWNALIKPNKDGQLAFFGYDPVTGTGGILRDYNGDGKADGATLFLKDNAPGDLNPDPFIIEDPIGGAELQNVPRLVSTADGLGLTVEGPEGLGLWVRLKTNSAETERQNSLQLISNQRNEIGTVGATRNNGNCGQTEIYLKAGEELRFQQSSHNQTSHTSPSIKLEKGDQNSSWSLSLEDETRPEDRDEDFNDLSISISGHLTPEDLASHLIARSQSWISAGVLNLNTLSRETVTLKIDVTSETDQQNRLAFVRFDDNNDILSINGINADGSEAFQNMVRQSLIDPNEQPINLSESGSTSLEWTLESADYGLYAPVLITSDGTVHTASNPSIDMYPGHLKILGMNHFGFEDTLNNKDSDWDFNDLTVCVSVI